ncbi:hypothetical protein HYU93_02635 [Candidatus Daviesbacteria bacterium]|nr:hypothetical protein [Candidatus Daviesbacteria bacterium]
MEGNAIKKRQSKLKEKLIEQFKKTPIVQIACEKVGVGRATYYRWRKDNTEFAQLADESLFEGITLMNDMAESKLLSAIKDGNLTGIIFWLKNRHNAYKTRVEISSLGREEVMLTDEQEEVIKKAIGLTKTETKEEEEK